MAGPGDRNLSNERVTELEKFHHLLSKRLENRRRESPFPQSEDDPECRAFLAGRSWNKS
jgi:hypothetical protein